MQQRIRTLVTSRMLCAVLFAGTLALAPSARAELVVIDAQAAYP